VLFRSDIIIPGLPSGPYIQHVQNVTWLVLEMYDEGFHDRNLINHDKEALKPKKIIHLSEKLKKIHLALIRHLTHQDPVLVMRLVLH
jgi:hypothetical protein